MSATWTEVSTKRVFCFDVEARPGPWGGGDFTWRNMLSIAGVYEDNPDTHFYLAPGFTAQELDLFSHRLRNTLVVTHNGPRYDFPFLNGTLMKMGLDPLGPILYSDTYAHLPKRGQAFSASLGNLANRFQVDHQKGHMGEFDWERAYDGDVALLEDLKLYNIGDCLTTLALRKKLLSLGLLGPPKTWRG